MRISDWSSDVCSSDLRIMIAAHAQEAAEGQHGIADLPAALVHHEVRDVAQPLPLSVVDGGALDPVGCDQVAMIFPRHVRHRHSPAKKSRYDDEPWGTGRVPHGRRTGGRS